MGPRPDKAVPHGGGLVSGHSAIRALLGIYPLSGCLVTPLHLRPHSRQGTEGASSRPSAPSFSASFPFAALAVVEEDDLRPVRHQDFSPA
jgi:hypothetical protein